MRRPLGVSRNAQKNLEMGLIHMASFLMLSLCAVGSLVPSPVPGPAEQPLFRIAPQQGQAGWLKHSWRTYDGTGPSELSTVASIDEIRDSSANRESVMTAWTASLQSVDEGKASAGLSLQVVLDGGGCTIDIWVGGQRSFRTVSSSRTLYSQTIQRSLFQSGSVTVTQRCWSRRNGLKVTLVAADRTSIESAWQATAPQLFHFSAGDRSTSPPRPLDYNVLPALVPFNSWGLPSTIPTSGSWSWTLRMPTAAQNITLSTNLGTGSNSSISLYANGKYVPFDRDGSNFLQYTLLWDTSNAGSVVHCLLHMDEVTLSTSFSMNPVASLPNDIAVSIDIAPGMRATMFNRDALVNRTGTVASGSPQWSLDNGRDRPFGLTSDPQLNVRLNTRLLPPSNVRRINMKCPGTCTIFASGQQVLHTEERGEFNAPVAWEGNSAVLVEILVKSIIEAGPIPFEFAWQTENSEQFVAIPSHAMIASGCAPGLLSTSGQQSRCECPVDRQVLGRQICDRQRAWTCRVFQAPQSCTLSQSQKEEYGYTTMAEGIPPCNYVEGGAEVRLAGYADCFFDDRRSATNPDAPPFQYAFQSTQSSPAFSLTNDPKPRALVRALDMNFPHKSVTVAEVDLASQTAAFSIVSRWQAAELPSVAGRVYMETSFAPQSELQEDTGFVSPRIIAYELLKKKAPPLPFSLDRTGLILVLLAAAAVLLLIGRFVFVRREEKRLLAASESVRAIDVDNIGFQPSHAAQPEITKVYKGTNAAQEFGFSKKED